MADHRCCAIMIGGKGSSLTPNAVFDVANNVRLKVHPSVLQRAHVLGDRSYSVPLPDFFTNEQCRATLVVVLNKLLHISPSSTCLSIVELLNSSPDSIPRTFNIADVTGDETVFLASCFDALEGVWAIIDHKTTSLCAVADMVAALSCEASGAKLSAFVAARCEDNYMLVPHHATCSVALEIFSLLNGSKLTGENFVDDISSIPRVHGSLREVLNTFQSRTRVMLNSADMGTTKKTWNDLLTKLMIALLNFGKSSLRRAQSNLESVRDDDVGCLLRRLITERCPTGERLDDLVSEALGEQHARILHLVDDLVGFVRAILSWEMTTALVSLETAELHFGEDGADDGGSGKEKRDLMGFRTGAVMIYIEDRLKHGGLDRLARIHKLAEFCESILTPKEEGSRNFGRILKIPKDIPYCMAFHPHDVRLNRGSIISANLRGNVVGLVQCGAENLSGEINCEGGYDISADVPLSDTYQMARYGRFRYHFALSSGSYSVSLYFAETFNVEHRDGIRVFDVRMNGKNAISGFDIGKDFGFLTPCGLFDYLVELKDGDHEGLVIEFDPQVGSALANVICVRKLPEYFGWWTRNRRVMCEFCEQEIDFPIEVAAQVESDLRAEYDIKLKQYTETWEREPLEAMLEKDEKFKEYYEQKIKETYDFFEESRKKGKEYMEALKKGLADVKAVGLGGRDIIKELEEIDNIRPHV